MEEDGGVEGNLSATLLDWMLDGSSLLTDIHVQQYVNYHKIDFFSL